MLRKYKKKINKVMQYSLVDDEKEQVRKNDEIEKVDRLYKL